MLLALDVGNTETTLGLFQGERLAAHWRLTTTPFRTPDEWASAITAYLIQAGHSTQEVRAAIVASVVPQVTGSVCDAVERATTVRPQVVDARSRLPITLDVEEPLTVGADRIVNTLAASQLFRRDAIVVDMGTATTFDCITSDGVFFGGVIAPGVQTALETLVRRTSKLPATELVVPPNVIGRRTEDCIRAGVMFGQAEAIDGLVRRIKKSWPRKQEPIVVATGGLAETFRTLCSEFDRVEPHLTLAGLQMAYAHLSRTA